MKRVKKPVFFIVALLILTFSYFAIFGWHSHYGDIPVTNIKGAQDIRWGIDIRGGVEATFNPANGVEATKENIDAAKAVVEKRLVSKNITDYELYTDYDNSRIIVRFPWNTGETNFDPESAIKELSATAVLTFREGNEYSETGQDEEGNQVRKVPKGVTADNVLVEGKDVSSAKLLTIPKSSQSSNAYKKTSTEMEYQVQLNFNEEGKQKFAEATKNLRGQVMSIWMDEIMISDPKISTDISKDGLTDGTAVISGIFTLKEAAALTNQINAGALPFKLEVNNFSTISPSLGMSSLYAMLWAGIIAFAIICIMMLVLFRLPGFIACIGLIGHVSLSFAAVSGFLSFIPSFTLTLPGIAGLILSIGIGVDTNIISASRIKEEILAGKPLNKAIEIGNKHSFWAIFDGNITVLIVSLVLMGIFGPSNILSFLFGASTTGSIYSFGYMLFVGVIANFIVGVSATHLMIKAISGYKFAKSKWLYGGVNDENI